MDQDRDNSCNFIYLKNINLISFINTTTNCVFIDKTCKLLYTVRVLQNNPICIIEGFKMIKNDIEIDTKVKCLEAKLTQQQLGEAIGTTGQYVNRIIKKKDKVINKTFVQMMEALGYDIVLKYEKRENK